MRHQLDILEAQALIPPDIDRNIVSIEEVGRGRNSQVYKLTCGDGHCYALKAYFQAHRSDRDRLAVEFSALRWLRQNQVTDIPRSIAADYAKGWALYEFVEGAPAGLSVTGEDIDMAVAFLAKLKELARTCPDSRELPEAAEACFSVKAILDNVNSRLMRLVGHGQDGALYADLDRFLANEFRHRLDEITKWSLRRLSEAGLSADAEIDRSQRTLSPSDFGFHNALKRNGRLVFVDFEYFGWDDPAKMVSDFLLHPGMELSETHKKRFARGIFDRFSESPTLPARVKIVYPLFGLKWCMIMLNEFLPDQMSRRYFAGADQTEKETLQAEQLAKAGEFLLKISEDYGNFPYAD